MYPVLPARFKRVSLLGLVKQGFVLHVATLVGSLRTSKQFRDKHGSEWKKIVLLRFIDEYGLNLLLLSVLQPIIFMFFLNDWIVAEVFAILMLPVLSVLQMVIDSIRPKCLVISAKEQLTGLTLKIIQTETKDKHGWAFMNHFAMPIGHKHGVDIRNMLHEQADAQGVDLWCRAQNADIADYYVAQHPGGIIVNTDRGMPLICWNYSKDAIQTRPKSDPLGFHAIQNSGQLTFRDKFRRKTPSN